RAEAEEGKRGAEDDGGEIVQENAAGGEVEHGLGGRPVQGRAADGRRRRARSHEGVLEGEDVAADQPHNQHSYHEPEGPAMVAEELGDVASSKPPGRERRRAESLTLVGGFRGGLPETPEEPADAGQADLI